MVQPLGMIAAFKGAMMKKRLGLVILLSIGAGCSALTGTQSGERSLARGQAVYEKNCEACHGAQGRGDGYSFLKPPPADLTGFATRNKTDAMLLATIRHGHANTAMGAWRVALSDEESRDVLAYVRTLQK